MGHAPTPAARAGRSSCWFWAYRPRGEGRRRLQKGGVGVQSAEALEDRWEVEAARTAPDGSVARGDLGEDGDANRNPHSEEN